MNTLNLGSDEMPEKKKKSNTRNLKIALGLAAVILVPTIGSTLAGGININSNTAVEFGQGVVATTACSATVTITPTSSLNAQGAFVLETIEVSGVDAACDNKYLTLKVLDGVTPVIIGTSTATFCRIEFDAVGAEDVYTHVAGDTCGTLGAMTAGGFTLTPTTKPSSDDVTKITIESGSVA